MFLFLGLLLGRYLFFSLICLILLPALILKGTLLRDAFSLSFWFFLFILYFLIFYIFWLKIKVLKKYTML
ncbi:MAG: hypothetical protein CL958_06730 [Euryarchaeota archaeon]|nr:hypothetical protein [Marinobacter sp.]